jgi:arginyl-tRNA synthetase
MLASWSAVYVQAPVVWTEFLYRVLIFSQKERYNFDKMFYVVASQQDLHLKQLFKITELLGHGELAKRCQHISFGLVLGMSTRKGTVKL